MCRETVEERTADPVNIHSVNRSHGSVNRSHGSVNRSLNSVNRSLNSVNRSLDVVNRSLNKKVCGVQTGAPCMMCVF